MSEIIDLEESIRQMNLENSLKNISDISNRLFLCSITGKEVESKVDSLKFLTTLLNQELENLEKNMNIVRESSKKTRI